MHESTANRVGPLLVVLFLILVLCPSAEARTWRVWKDGSGDYTVIQDAVDASAPGDTVLIGPGRYTESFEFQYDTTTSGETFVGIDKDDLALIGVHRDSVVIGPRVANIVGELPKGIAMGSGMATGLRLEHLTVRNVADGARLREEAWLRDCALDSCDIGLLALTGSRIELQSCRLNHNLNRGGLVFRGVSTTFRDCEMVGSFLDGLACVQSAGVRVEDCRVSDSRVGIHLQQESSGEVVGTTIHNTHEVSIVVGIGSSAHIEHTTLEAAEEGILVSTSRVTGHHNRLGPFDLHVMNMLGDSEVSMTHSDFILGPTPSIRLDGYSSEPPTMYLDFTDNWWGTTDPLEIADQIRDKNDDETIDGVVVFEPFRASSAPTEIRSMSSFKALFGGR